jgi:hypothetical protein
VYPLRQKHRSRRTPFSQANGVTTFSGSGECSGIDTFGQVSDSNYGCISLIEMVRNCSLFFMDEGLAATNCQSKHFSRIYPKAYSRKCVKKSFDRLVHLG